MGTGITYEADASFSVPVQHQRLPKELHLLDRVFIQLGGSSDGLPVAPHQFAHGSTGADPG